MYQVKIKCRVCEQIELVDTVFKGIDGQTVEYLYCSNCWNKKFNDTLGICEECGNKFNIKEDCKCQKT